MLKRLAAAFSSKPVTAVATAKPKPASFADRVIAHVQAELDKEPGLAAMVIGIHIDEAKGQVSIWSKTTNPRHYAFIDQSYVCCP